MVQNGCNGKELNYLLGLTFYYLQNFKESYEEFQNVIRHKFVDHFTSHSYLFQGLILKRQGEL